jgi:hypothetical protein
MMCKRTVLLFVLLAAFTAAQQNCSFVLDGSDPVFSQVCNSSQFGLCSFTCLCFGYDSSFPQQLAESCSSSEQFSSFCWWNITVNSTDYVVDYTITYDADVHSDSTTHSIGSVRTFAVPPGVAYAMQYSPNSRNVTNSFVSFSGKNRLLHSRLTFQLDVHRALQSAPLLLPAPSLRQEIAL